MHSLLRVEVTPTLKIRRTAKNVHGRPVARELCVWEIVLYEHPALTSGSYAPSILAQTAMLFDSIRELLRSNFGHDTDYLLTCFYVAFLCHSR
jgi:hypothetical protein